MHAIGSGNRIEAMAFTGCASNGRTCGIGSDGLRQINVRISQPGDSEHSR